MTRGNARETLARHYVDQLAQVETGKWLPYATTIVMALFVNGHIDTLEGLVSEGCTARELQQRFEDAGKDIRRLVEAVGAVPLDIPVLKSR